MTAKTFAGRRHRAICPPVPGHPGQLAVREQAQLLALASVTGDRISVRHTGAKLTTKRTFSEVFTTTEKAPFLLYVEKCESAYRRP